MDTHRAKQKERQKLSNQQDLMMQGCKGQVRPCSMGSKGARMLPLSWFRARQPWRHPTGERLVDGVQGRAKSPLGHGGVGGAGTLRLTGDATAIRCTGFDDLLNGCHSQQRWRLGKRMESRRGRFAGGDATGHAQRVPLAKVAMVLPSTPCGSR